MFKENQKPVLSIVVIAILATAISRLIPHMPNFAPIAAIGLFCGFYLKNYFQAMFLTFGGVIISDILKEFQLAGSGFYGLEQIFVYVSLFYILYFI